MKAIVTCTAWRTQYLPIVLHALSQNQTAGWTIYVGMEPNYPEVHALVRSVRFMPCVNWINGYQLGAELNPFVSIQRAVNDGASGILYMDDDMLLSPDALELCDWYLSQPDLLNEERFVGLNLCTKASDPTKPDLVTDKETWEGLVSQGNCFTPRQWKTFIKRSWFVYHDFFGGDGYDWAWTHMALHLKKIILRPRLSRSRHIGKHGVHGDDILIFPEHISDRLKTDFVLE